MSERLPRDELRTLFLFESLTDDQLDWIAARGYVLTFDGPAEVCTEGAPATCLYILLDGELQTLRRSGKVADVDASWLFIFIGAAPRTGWLDGTVHRDARGFVLSGPDLLTDGQRPAGWDLDRDPYYLETSLPGVFVAGDVRHDSVKRVASAVGEGAMATTLVHRYLEKL